MKNISDNELITLALIGALHQAASFRNSRTRSEELAKLEQEIIPELSILSQTEAEPAATKKSKKKRR